jgi:hypothetical protein
MITKSTRILLLGLLLLTGSVVHAEGECPPGMFPTNPPGTQGPVGCAPIPGYDQQAPASAQQPAIPPPQWKSEWGAIATDGPGGHLGTAVNGVSREVAEQTALADCRTKGGSNCKLENTYSNACAAMIVGDAGHNSNSAATLDEAIALGIKTCSKAGDKNCHAFYSACSLPVRIQ